MARIRLMFSLEISLSEYLEYKQESFKINVIKKSNSYLLQF